VRWGLGFTAPPTAAAHRLRYCMPMNEDELNALEPIPWLRRAARWLLLVGLPLVAVLLLLRAL
jgi:hypothetical protein